MPTPVTNTDVSTSPTADVRALPATSGLLSQPVANQGQEMLNRRGLLR